MSFKFSIPTVAIATFLVLSHSAIASAEVYKTSKGQVVVTGLTAKQKYPVQTVNAKNNARTLKSKDANTCGEVTVDNAATYKSLVVGTEKIDPATLNTKEHPRCNGSKKTATAPKKKGVVKSTTSTVVTPSTTIPTTVPATAPATK
jgi:hypothetical protein